MSEPLETPCGRIKIYPAGERGGYWRLEYYEHGKRRQTSAGRSQESANAKVQEILKRLDADLQPESDELLETALEAYLRWAHREWTSEQHFRASQRELRTVLEPYSRLRCRQLDLRILKKICNAASTEGVARNRRSRLRSLLTWGRREGYFSADQTKLLDDYRYVPARDEVVKPRRKPTRKTNSEGKKYVTKDEVPLHGQVRALASALQERLRYGELMIEFAAATGLRIGELCALDADHVDLVNRRIEVELQVTAVPQLDGMRVTAPKGNKVRTAIYPAVAPTEYRLGHALAARLAEVEREHADGINPHRLLFPAPKGDYWWTTAFTNDYFTPAAERAGWERLSWKEGGKTRYQWKHTMHSLRHRMAHDAIELWKLTPAELMAVGGWDSITVVFEMYYGQSKDLLDKVYLKTAVGTRDETPPAHQPRS